MHIHHEVGQGHRLLEEAFGGAPAIAGLDGLKIGQHGAFFDELPAGIHHALDGAVVDEDVGLPGFGVEGLLRDVHGGKAVAVLGKVGKEIGAARHGDHLGNVIAALTDVDEVVAGDGEEGDRLPRGVLIEQRLDAGELIGEDALGLLGFAQQQADAFDPLHPGQRAALVARALHEDGHAEFFQLLLDLGGVVDHGVLDGKAAVRSEDALVIRGAVLARIGDLP